MVALSKINADLANLNTDITGVHPVSGDFLCCVSNIGRSTVIGRIPSKYSHQMSKGFAVSE
jgi:hypothetical protein